MPLGLVLAPLATTVERTVLSAAHAGVFFAVVAVIGTVLFVGRRRIWEVNTRGCPARTSDEAHPHRAQPMYVVSCVTFPLVLATAGIAGCIFSLTQL